MASWRSEVGSDFYPAMRLILPDKDRDRGVYGLKENTIGKLLVKVMKIDKNSEDGYNLMHWKLPGQSTSSRSVGDFAGRCYEVLSKRQMRTQPGELTIADVNVLLDRLAAASGEAEQLPIFEEFYQNMNAEELMWLVRIILKDMKVGATERTFLGLWHPDAEALFNVSSSLRRVCWELHDPAFRLEQEETGVTLMQCFQPQLAQFQMTTTFAKLVANLGVTEDDNEFWIEEKLDGERMQMHMQEDNTVPGGFRFAFWSRKAKDYTYLYGCGLEDENSALTRHLRGAFDPNARNIILDGEMITWDTDVDKIVPFGTLKSAALEQQKNPNKSGPRPLYRVFDILLLNDRNLGDYTLSDRYKALERAVTGVHRRLEVLPHEVAHSPDAVEPFLRRVVAEASEGLVLKNPRSRYRLNSRNNDWIKVKPEYMSEFGESIDCVVIGGYFGSGRRGGTLSSFLCGLRMSQNYVKAGASPEKCLSLFKVGGGFKAEDYAEIKHHTEGKWRDWDAANPPSEYIELGGGERFQYERPDVWIRPRDSVVLSVKAASFGQSDQFAMGWTLRFPRFRKLRLDKAWDAGLDVDEFEALRTRVNQEEKERKEMEMENRKRKPSKRARQELVIVGTDPDAAPRDFADMRRLKGDLFKGLDFCVLSESVAKGPYKMAKPGIEKLIKEHGGRIHQQVPAAGPGAMIVVADKNVVKVAALKKKGGVDIVRPKWVFDCLAQRSSHGRRKSDEADGFLLPFEEGHLLFATEQMHEVAVKNTDRFGDSFARDVRPAELLEILDHMDLASHSTSDDDDDDDDDAYEGTSSSQRAKKKNKRNSRKPFDVEQFFDQLEEHGRGDELDTLKSFMFRRCRVVFATLDEKTEDDEMKVLRLKNYVRFGNGVVVEENDVPDQGQDDGVVTHIVIVAKDAASEREVAANVRYKVSSRKTIPRIVTQKWVEESWAEGTLLDEEGFVA